MDPTLALLIFNVVQLWGKQLNKPEGWVPTQEDIDKLIAEVDAATPEARKAISRARLGLPPVP